MKLQPIYEVSLRKLFIEPTSIQIIKQEQENNSVNTPKYFDINVDESPQFIYCIIQVKLGLVYCPENRFSCIMNIHKNTQDAFSSLIRYEEKNEQSEDLYIEEYRLVDNQYISGGNYYAIGHFLTADNNEIKNHSFICPISDKIGHKPDPRKLTDVICNPSETLEELTSRIENYRKCCIKNDKYFETLKSEMEEIRNNRNQLYYQSGGLFYPEIQDYDVVTEIWKRCKVGPRPHIFQMENFRVKDPLRKRVIE